MPVNPAKSRSHSRIYHGCLIGCGTVGLFLMALLAIPAYFVISFITDPDPFKPPDPATDSRARSLVDQPLGKQYTKTRFEFRYGKVTRIVDDPRNQMQWVYGDLPYSISVTNGTRLIVYRQPSAIIKSRKDSMEVFTDSFKHKGYMGISDKEGKHFVVDKNGIVQRQVEPKSPQPKPLKTKCSNPIPSCNTKG
jgi:hypothetical protein